MTFHKELEAAQLRMKEFSDFQNRWRSVQEELPENFSLSRLADGSATLHIEKFVPDAEGGAGLSFIPVFPCIEKSARFLGMISFCRVLRAYGMGLRPAALMYRVCVPPE